MKQTKLYVMREVLTMYARYVTKTQLAKDLKIDVCALNNLLGDTEGIKHHLTLNTDSFPTLFLNHSQRYTG